MTAAATRVAGAILLGVVIAAAALAPVLAPHLPTHQLDQRLYAPPTPIRLVGPDGWQAPFIHAQVLDDQLRRRYHADRARPVRIEWFTRGRLVSTPPGSSPLLLLGADGLGRDVFSRLLHGASRSIGVALVGAAFAIAIGALVGAFAGSRGGSVDRLLMSIADFVIVLPAAYLVLVLRGLLPRDLTTGELFGLIAAFFALAAWPQVARGVRAIVAAERRREYAEAARAAGAGPWRLATALLPAAHGFLATQFLLLVPALLLAEVTISFLGLGFGDAAPSWGTMLSDLANVRVIGEAPWMLAPAAAIFVVVLAIQLVVGPRVTPGVLALTLPAMSSVPVATRALTLDRPDR